jgi:hypothetical protein
MLGDIVDIQVLYVVYVQSAGAQMCEDKKRREDSRGPAIQLRGRLGRRVGPSQVLT